MRSIYSFNDIKRRLDRKVSKFHRNFMKGEMTGQVVAKTKKHK